MSNGPAGGARGTEPTESSGTAAQRGAMPGMAASSLPDPALRRVAGAAARLVGRWQGCLSDPALGSKSAGLSCPSARPPVPQGARPACVSAGCQGAVGELQPWLTVPRPAGVTGRWEGGEGRQVSPQLSHSWVPGATPWAWGH